MPLRSEVVVVPSWPGSRDVGKNFLISEMDAVRAEKWAWRAFFALKGSSERIPENIAGLGMVGIAIVGLNVFLQADVDPARFEALLDEMLTCVRVVRDPKTKDAVSGGPIATDLLPGDVEEVRTLAWLRSEVLRVHTGFSPADAISTLASAIQARMPEVSPSA